MFSPSPLAGEGWDGGERRGLGAPPAFTPTLALPRQGGGDVFEHGVTPAYRHKDS